MPCLLLFGVIPVVVLPLAMLAMLLTALFAVPLAIVRRWWMVLNVAVAGIALYVVRFTFEGFCKQLDATDAWWARPSAFWAAVCVIAAAGAMWVRWRRAKAARPTAAHLPLGDRLVLLFASLVCLAAMAYCILDARAFMQPMLVVSMAVWVGTVYAFAPAVWGLTHLTTQEVILWVLALACAAVGAAPGQVVR
jgi:hypothetical protein